MKAIDSDAINGLRLRASSDEDPLKACMDLIGDTEVAGGLWRFYSDSFPAGGIVRFNSAAWRDAWGSLIPSECLFVGEDVFGNQIVVSTIENPCAIWNHESGEFFDLDLSLPDLLEIVRDSGVEWLGFYGNGEVEVAERLLPTLMPSQHIHWVAPLIFGGERAINNAISIERNQHLGGHGKLAVQL